jgi:transcriptional regulator with XRE-family HTH domain
MKKSPPKLSARLVFARNLRQIRRLKDLSQEALALNADLSRTYVSGVERGDRNISIDNMDSLAVAVGVPLKELVDPDMLKDLKGITP